ncbi:MAG TPA: c-type cytochrome [Vicinamibacterales bacterium]|nr:c-type cytochrome [Vicinamibacterales bacterium]
MRVSTSVCLAAALSVASIAAAQSKYLPAEVDAGNRLYTSNCTGCHGPEGDGVAGVNFSQGKFRRGATDDDLTRIIVRGIPGTPMPPSGMSEGQVGTIVAYLRSMSAAGDTSGPAGDPARGQAIVEGKGECLTCHSIGVNGLHLGPSLTEIGAERRGVELMRSLVDPSAEIRPDNRTVTLTMRNGRTITGRFLNQDTFSIQLIDASDKLVTIDKSAVRESALQTTSPMPSFKNTLDAQQLADVVSYLKSLKGRP